MWTYLLTTATGLVVYRRDHFATWDRAIRSLRKSYPRIMKQLHEGEDPHGHRDT